MPVPPQSAPHPQQPASLFSPDTIKGLRAATADARRAVETGSSAIDAFGAIRVCERVAHAVAAADRGNINEARRLLAVALPSTDDPRLLFLGFQFHFRTGDYTEAERLTRRRLEAVGPDTADAARAWNNLGLIRKFTGDAAEAERMMLHALEIDRGIGNDLGVARDLGNLAILYEERGELDHAESLYCESLSMAERLTGAAAISISASKYANLGDIALARGRRSDASALWKRAEQLFGQAGDERYRAAMNAKIAELAEPV